MKFDLANIYANYTQVWSALKYLGRPVADVVETGKPAMGAIVFKTAALELKFETIPPIITVSGKKNIVTSQIAGLDYSIKEIISLDDWDINIKGFCVNGTPINVKAPTVTIEKLGIQNKPIPMGFPRVKLHSKEFPEQDFINMVELFKNNTEVDVESRYLNFFGIRHIVIKDIQFPTAEIFENSFAWEINAMSDFPIESEMMDYTADNSWENRYTA